VHISDIEELRKRAAHYRAQAAEYFATAEGTFNPDAKTELLKNAEEWRALAEGTEALIREIQEASIS
jgi:anti-sigma factor RsiW